MLQELSGAIASGRAALSALLDLIALEARGAGIALMWILALAAVAALCAAAAWLGFTATLVLWALSLGYSPIAVAAVFSLLNLLAGAALIALCMNLSRSLLFSATRRKLAGGQAGGASAP
jgi:uncharacterized membrane protein YqjE